MDQEVYDTLKSSVEKELERAHDHDNAVVELYNKMEMRECLEGLRSVLGSDHYISLIRDGVVLLNERNQATMRRLQAALRHLQQTDPPTR